MAQHPSMPSTSSTLYPQLETTIAPLDDSESSHAILKIDKELAKSLRAKALSGDPFENVGDFSIFPSELLPGAKKTSKPKIDPLKRLKELTTDDQEDEEETEEDEQEDEEAVEDEEEDAGGDYLVSHFDNGENFEDNDDEGDDMTSMI